MSKIFTEDVYTLWQTVSINQSITFIYLFVYLPICKSYTWLATRKANKAHLVLVAH